MRAASSDQVGVRDPASACVAHALEPLLGALHRPFRRAVSRSSRGRSRCRRPRASTGPERPPRGRRSTGPRRSPAARAASRARPCRAARCSAGEPAQQRRRTTTNAVACGPPDPGDRCRHDREADHRDEQHGVRASSPAMSPYTANPAQVIQNGQEQDGVQRRAVAPGVLVHEVRQLADARDDHEVEEELLPGRVPLGLGCGRGRLTGRRSRTWRQYVERRAIGAVGPGGPRVGPFAQVFWTGDRLSCTVFGDRSPGLRGGVSIPSRTTGPEVKRVATRVTDEH